MNAREFDQLIGKFLEGKCTPEQERVILEWYDHFPKQEVANRAEMRNELWMQLEARMHTRERRLSVPRFLTALKIAASVILVVALSVVALMVTRTSTTETRLLSVRNDGNEEKVISLEDGSHVFLAAHSELQYPEHFSDSTRNVFLVGKAFFEVARNPAHPFIVLSGQVQTKVLGTSFTITAFDDSREVSVAVKTGKVSVSHEVDVKGKRMSVGEVFLTPNQQAIYDKATATISLGLVEKPLITEGKEADLQMRYSNSPVGEVFTALEEAYGVEIRYDKQKMKHCVITTSLLADENLFERLGVICFALGASYEKNGTVINIQGKGCKERKKQTIK